MPDVVVCGLQQLARLGCAFELVALINLSPVAVVVAVFDSCRCLLWGAGVV